MSGGALLILVLAAMLPSFVISLIAVGMVRRAAVRLGLMDKPGARKVHTTPIPLGGGLGIWAGVVGAMAIGTAAVLVANSRPELFTWLPSELTQHVSGMADKIAEIWGLIGCATVLMILGLMDDRRGLPWQIRIGVEFAVAWHGQCLFRPRSCDPLEFHVAAALIHNHEPKTL